MSSLESNHTQATFALSEDSWRVWNPILKNALLVMLIASALVLTACGAGNEAKVREQAEYFLADIKVGAWHAAYSRMHSDLQAACGSAADLERRVTRAQQQPDTWEFVDISAREYTGYIQLKITMREGATAYSNLSLAREGELGGKWGDEFKVQDWRIDAQGGVCGEL